VVKQKNRFVLLKQTHSTAHTSYTYLQGISTEYRQAFEFTTLLLCSDMDSEMTRRRDECQSIYQNLIDCHEFRSGGLALSSLYVKEFQQTARCDELNDFSSYRKELGMMINENDPSRLDRIVRCEDTQIDEKFAASACMHYYKVHLGKLVRALTWPNYLYYHVVERAERAVAGLGVFGAGFYTIQVVHNSVAAIKRGNAGT
jgi:hypothetical protein